MARGGPRDLFLLRGHMLDSNCHVLAHMTHSLYLSPSLLGHTSLSLQHLDYHTLLQYNHIYIVIISSNAHSLVDLIEASIPRYLDSSILPKKQAL